MAQGLSVLALAEDTRLVSRTYLVSHSHLLLQFRGAEYPLLNSSDARHTRCTYMQVKHLDTHKVLVRVSISVKRHHDCNNFYKGKYLMGVLRTSKV